MHVMQLQSKTKLSRLEILYTSIIILLPCFSSIKLMVFSETFHSLQMPFYSIQIILWCKIEIVLRLSTQHAKHAETEEVWGHAPQEIF